MFVQLILKKKRNLFSRWFPFMAIYQNFKLLRRHNNLYIIVQGYSACGREYNK